MQYLGGKTSGGTNKWIAEHLRPHLPRPYYEPFCGVCSVAWVLNPGKCYLSDAHPYLIAMWNALQKGWVPPSFVGEDLYTRIKADPTAYPAELVGFVGFFCAFSGNWFSTYARGSDNSVNQYFDADMRKHVNFALRARDGKNGTRKRIAVLKDAEFRCCNYDEVDYQPNSLIYCDPPYIGRTQYAGVEPFDHDRFWDWVRKMSTDGHVVLVSEFDAPEDMTIVAAKSRRARMLNHQMVEERLYRYQP